MTKDEVIDQLWERSNHGTRREDVVAAYEAGAAAEREACAKVADEISNKYAFGYYGQEVDTADEIAATIRARSKA